MATDIYRSAQCLMDPQKKMLAIKTDQLLIVSNASLLTAILPICPSSTRTFFKKTIRNTKEGNTPMCRHIPAYTSIYHKLLPYTRYTSMRCHIPLYTCIYTHILLYTLKYLHPWLSNNIRKRCLSDNIRNLWLSNNIRMQSLSNHIRNSWLFNNTMKVLVFYKNIGQRILTR